MNTVKVSIVKGFSQLAMNAWARRNTTSTEGIQRFSRRSVLVLAMATASFPAVGDIKTDALARPAAPAAANPETTKTTETVVQDGAEAIYRQARGYDLGQGVAQDYSRALKLYLDAAEQGHISAMLSAGLMLSQGQGGPSDPREAARWLMRAADRGSPDGQYSVGVLYMQGRGVEKSFPQAIRWFTRAARSGHPQAMNNLGVIHANGLGTEKDNVRAYAWFVLGAEAGSRDAADNQRITAAALTAKERADGDALAAELGTKSQR